MLNPCSRNHRNKCKEGERENIKANATHAMHCRFNPTYLQEHQAHLHVVDWIAIGGWVEVHLGQGAVHAARRWVVQRCGGVGDHECGGSRAQQPATEQHQQHVSNMSASDLVTQGKPSMHKRQAAYCCSCCHATMSNKRELETATHAKQQGKPIAACTGALTSWWLFSGTTAGRAARHLQHTPSSSAVQRPGGRCT